MQQRIWEYITKYDLIQPGNIILVGISGGQDSVALLHIMKHLGEDKGFKIQGAHLNHGLREESDSDEQFVKDLCSDWNIQVTTRKVDIGSLARSRKKSLEDVGRDERYRFMEELGNKIGAEKIAIAHHRRDQAETVLMHLIQGTGALGLQGMLPRRGMIIRPMLDTKLEEITEYIKINGLPYRIDSTNFDKNYLRNRIRWELLPLLEQSFNPGVEDGLCRLAKVMARENQYWNDQIQNKWPDIVSAAADGILQADVAEFGRLPSALDRRFIQRLLTQAGGSRISEADIDRVLDLIGREGAGKKVRVSGGLWVTRTKDALKLGTVKPKTDTSGFQYELSIPGHVAIPEAGIELTCQLMETMPARNKNNAAYFDWDAIEKPLCVRSRLPGDKFRPDGFRGTKKLQDFFTDAKIPAAERNRIGIIASAREIYWLIGQRKSDTGKVNADTKTILEICFKKRGADLP